MSIANLSGQGGGPGSGFSKLDAYGTNDMHKADPITYVGKTKEGGDWLFQKINKLSATDTLISYANQANNPLVLTYTDANTNYATLTYGPFHEVAALL